MNDGDTPLKVKVTILPANESYEGIDIPKHEAKKVQILFSFSLSYLISPLIDIHILKENEA